MRRSFDGGRGMFCRVRISWRILLFAPFGCTFLAVAVEHHTVPGCTHHFPLVGLLGCSHLLLMIQLA